MDREPVLLWRYFENLCRIPRASGNEAGVRAYIGKFAETHNFAYISDNSGNCLVSVPGRGRGRNAPAVIIQSHMDMVCVKDEEHRDHDFSRDPIRTRVERWNEKGRDREFLMATGTTLGADNGIGLVAALAVAVDPAIVDCPPLELLFTVEEETGLTGARKLDPALLRADLLINLDTEEIGEICVSCAGGRDMVAQWNLQRSAPSADEVPVRLTLSGLPGGHSGVQIHERRGNAIVLLLQAVLSGHKLNDTLRLAAFSGGTARNVIPSHAEMVVWVPETKVGALETLFQDPSLPARIEAAIDTDEPGKIVCASKRRAREETPWPLSTEQTRLLLNAIEKLPNGVQTWSAMVEGLVETSNNVAVITTSEDTLTLQCSTRSSREGAIEAFQEAARKELEASGAVVTFGDGYPGWPADPHNPLLGKAVQTFEAVLGYTPKVMAVHAGLECGVLKGKRPTLQMISFGPDIFGAHTTNERIALDTVPPFYACLSGLLSDLSRS